MTRTRIRLARPHDLALLPDIELAASHLFVEAGFGGVTSVMPLAELEAARAEGGLMVAVDERDAPVGFAVVKSTQAGAHLCEMNVHPKHGRQGIGTALLQACLAGAAGRPMTLTTYSEVPWNAPFYTNQGFVVVPPEAWCRDGGVGCSGGRGAGERAGGDAACGGWWVDRMGRSAVGSP